MQVTTAQIWERIHTAGIATPEQCRQWAKSVSEAIGPSGIADPAAVIKELVQQDKLSPYQANVLYRGLTHPLQLGKLRVTRSLEAERGPNWYEGEDAEGARWSAFPPKAVWMVAMPDEKLAQQSVQDWPPSLQWAQQHCQVQSPHLDRWINAGATLKHLFAVCESVPGLLLSEMLDQGPLSSTQAYRMLRDIAMGLKFLHHHRLVHGHLSTHAVVWNEIRGFLLLRDPIFPPRSPYHAPTLSVLGGHKERLALGAPELFHTDAFPTIQSDLYALGCLWFRCLTGNWPIDPGPEASPEVWAKLHAQVPVVIPSRLPEVQKRCLLHLLAKDPACRFAGVDPLLRALDQLVLPQNTESQIAESQIAQAASVPELPKMGAKKNPEPDTKPTKNPPVSKAITDPASKQPDEQKPRAIDPVAKPANLQAKQNTEGNTASPQNPKPAKEPEIKPAAGNTPPTSTPVVTPVAVNKATSSPVEPKPVVPRQPSAKQSTDQPVVQKSSAVPQKPISQKSETTPAKTPQSNSPVAPVVPVSPIEPATQLPDTNLESSKRPANESTPGNDQSKAKQKTDAASNSNQANANQGSAPSGASGNKVLTEFSEKSKPQPKKKNKKKSVASKPFGPRKKAKKPVWFMPLVVACSLLLLSVLFLLLRGNSKGLVTIEPKSDRKSDSQSVPVTPPSLADSGKSGKGGPDPMLEYYNVKSEDSGVPWTPPTVGAPYSTEMLPQGLEALLMISPDSWAQSSPASKEIAEWWKSVYSQGPDLSDLPSFSTEAFASMSIAWYPGESTGSYRKTYRLGWKEPKSLDVLIPDIGQWKSQEIQLDNKKYRYWTKEHQGQTLSLITDDFSSKADQQVKRIAIGSFELLQPLLESQGKSGPLRRQLDALLQNTDSRSDVTFLAAPSFVFVDGKQMFAEHSDKIIGLMREIIDDRVQAILIRTHFEPQLYLEFRMFGNDIQSAPRDAVQLKQKLDSMAEQVESQLTAQPAAAYWRAIANRFPQMLRSVNKYARSGAEDGQVVFNVYLPKEAASNLAIGAWMSLEAGSGPAPTKVATAPKPTSNAMKTVDEMLDAKISLRVEQESLEVVLQSIATELKETHNAGMDALPMAINGTAFQKDGITRNQQIRNFEFKDTPVREILTALCRKANPVTTVQKPNEKDQKVVWLLLDDPNSPSKKKLDMTTRAWSESNQAMLPKEFVE